MDKSKICVSFILLFSFMLSSHVLAHELPQTSLTEPSFDSTTQTVIEKPENQDSHNDKGNVVKNPKPTSSQNLEIDQSGVSSMSSLKHSVEHGYTIPTLKEKENQHYDDGKVSKEQNPTSSYDLERKRRGDSNMHRFSKRHGYKTTSSEETEKQENQHSHKDKGNVVKNPKPTSSQNLEMDRNGVSSMFSLRHSVGHGYTIPTLKEKGKSDLSKDVAEVDKSGLENRKLDWKIVIGGGDRRGSTGGIGDGGFGNGGWGGDFISTEPLNYKDASIMRHQNMKKFSEFDRESFRESQATKKFGTKNGDKIYYSVPRMEDIGEDKKN
uniref:Uncharacterized protein n=1 Tax=Lupinus angustifolius TaxID=3871 RepID=A0A182BFG1_LUPAN|nr:hypothetical protein [Lupinus angustifolius]